MDNNNYFIGNFVKAVWIADGKEYIVKIDGYNKTYDSYHVSNDYLFNTCGGLFLKKEEMTPIPISLDILKKNGWTKHKYTNGYVQYCLKKKGYPKLNMINDNKYEFHWGNYDMAIKFVHQLQNLLCGLQLDDNIKM